MVYAEQSDRKRAESDDLAAIEILERLQAAAPNDSIAHELSRCYNNYANLYKPRATKKRLVCSFQSYSHPEARPRKALR